jgi:hypothetical protein
MECLSDLQHVTTEQLKASILALQADMDAIQAKLAPLKKEWSRRGEKDIGLDTAFGYVTLADGGEEPEWVRQVFEDSGNRLQTDNTDWDTGLREYYGPFHDKKVSSASFTYLSDPMVVVRLTCGARGSEDYAAVEVSLALMDGMFNVEVDEIRQDDSYIITIRIADTMEGEINVLASAFRWLSDALLGDRAWQDTGACRLAPTDLSKLSIDDPDIKNVQGTAYQRFDLKDCHHGINNEETKK